MTMTLDRIESAAVNVVARLTPWLAPAATAYIVFEKTTLYFGWPWWVGILAAVPIEALGLVTTYVAVSLYAYNRSRNKTEPPAPLWLAVALVGVYFAAAELLTVGLHVAPRIQAGQVTTLADWSLAVFPVLSLVAVATIALRVDQDRRVQENAEAARSRSESRKATRAARKAAQDGAKMAQVAQPSAQSALPRTATAQDWRAIRAGLNGNGENLDASCVADLVTSAGFALPSRRTVQAWAKKTKG